MRSPWNTIRAWFANVLRGEDPQRQERWFLPYPIAGVNLSPDETLSLATVWACIDIITKNIASCHWSIFEPVPGTSRRKRLDSDWRTWMLNTRPNDEMTAIGFREAMLFQAIPFGNAYAEIVTDVGGRVRQLWPLMSDRMQVRRGKTGQLEYRYTQSDGTQVTFNPRQIFHLRGPGMWGLMGDNIIARAAKTLGLAAAQERYSASFFGQGAQPIGTLELAGKLDDDTHARLKRDWAEKYKGPENAHKPLILEQGMKFNAISIDPQKSQLTESKKFTVEEICRWFGVPPHKVQHLEHATFSNIEHSAIEFVRDSLRPWERRLCQEADAKLFDQNRGPWKCTEIDLSPLTRGDALSRAQAQASWRQNGIMTANEIRAQEGLDDCGDDGDVLLVPMNLTTVEQIVTRRPSEGGDLDPSVEGADDDDELEIDVTEDAAPMNVVALQCAMNVSLTRFGRRLEHRREALRAKPNRAELLAEFRQEQYKVIQQELKIFSPIVVSVLGRDLTLADITRAVSLYEGGENIETLVHLLPTTKEAPCPSP